MSDSSDFENIITPSSKVDFVSDFCTPKRTWLRSGARSFEFLKCLKRAVAPGFLRNLSFYSKLQLHVTHYECQRQNKLLKCNKFYVSPVLSSIGTLQNNIYGAEGSKHSHRKSLLTDLGQEHPLVLNITVSGHHLEASHFNYG